MPHHLYRRGKIWWARTKIAGRDIRSSLRTSNRNEASARLDGWLASINKAAWQGENDIEEGRGFMDAVLKFEEEHLPRSVRPGTAERYRCSIRALTPYFKNMALVEISRRAISSFIADRQKAGVTNATIRRDLTAMSRILSGAVAAGWCEHNPSREYDRSLIRERRDPIIPPTDKDVETFISACPPTFGKIVRILAETGMRQQEAVGLEWRQVDLKRNEITLYHTKTGRPRVVPLSVVAQGTIRGTKKHKESPLVFWHGEGERFNKFANQFMAIMDRLEIKSFRCHDLRHKFAIDYLKAGGDIYALSKLLGHTSVKTTEIYLGYAGAQKGAQSVLVRKTFSHRKCAITH